MGAFEKIIGYEDIKAELRRFCDVLKYPEKYARLGVTIPRGVLLYGDPGLGKTLMAKSFIEESGCEAITLRKDKPNGDFVNLIRETFEKARGMKRAIVFLDDMDKFANEDNMHRDAEEYVAVQSCIDDCKESKVFVIATVNDRYCLPDSLMRAGRFDKVIEMKSPRGKDAVDIIKHYLEQKAVMGDIDAEEVARLMERRSCAELETVINEAGIYAGYDGRDKIDQKDLVKACMRMMFESPECVNPETDSYTRYVARHEAGHAVVSEVLSPGSVSLISICRHTGDVEGITSTHKEEGYELSKELQENEVIKGLGGKAAIEITYGISDMGCNGDMHKVFDIVSGFVDNVCAYGFETFETGSASNYLLEKKDRMIAAEMEKYYQASKKIIAENRDFLDAITSELMEKMTLTYRDIQRIKTSLVKVA